ncbi:MAG: HEAT repeat domain-containing protein [Planctomycetota bacterium]|nr:HEAT repeat domain-containing protein [Planctomycetota bacterium]
MKKTLLIGAALLAGGLALAHNASAHGGTYRGPGDTVPPGGGGGTGGGPATPGPSGPGTPGPSGPSTPGPSTPTGPAGTPPAGSPAGPTTGGGDTGPDLSTWDFWWGFNKDQYLNLKANTRNTGVVTGGDDWLLGKGEEEQTKDTLAPSQKQIREIVVPALLKVLDKERGNDLITGSLIALAKIGDKLSEADTSEFEQVIKQFLKDGNQEISETAAVALGILANDASVELLTQLMNDDPAARSFMGKTEVPFRTRAFSAYGLGLIGHATSNNELRRQIAASLVGILNTPSFAKRDLKVAAMVAFGLTPVDAGAEESADESLTPEEAAASSRKAQLNFLLDYYDEANQREHSRTRHHRVRAHAPTAMARLLADQGAEFEEVRSQVIEKMLEGVNKHSKYNRNIQQSCVLALGQLVDARGGKKNAHRTAHEELDRICKKGELQSKRYALISMAQIAARPAPESIEDPTGGRDDLRKNLLARMSKAKGGQAAWAGLAVGVHARALSDGGQETIDLGALSALRSEAKKSKSPDLAGAYMLALGLANDQDSAELILDKLEYFSQDETRGHCAVALGLMNYTQAVEPIQEILDGSEFRPDLLKQAAVALGLLGDKNMVERLVKMLGDAKSLSSQAAIASALGTIGDKNSIDGLVELLKDSGKTQTARGFAAVALGIVCDKELLPWNAKIGTNINYRANTETLTGAGSTGILDLL